MADTTTLTYSQDDVTCIVNTTIVENFTKLKVSKTNDKWSMKEGCHGEVTRSKKGTKLGSIEITLLQSSPINSELSYYDESDLLLPIAINDNNGNSLHLMPEGTIMKIPDVEYGEEVAEVTWVISGMLTKHFLGGNN